MTNSLNLLKTRRSAKRFVADFKIEESKATEILESIRFAPTSFGLEPFRVLYIENKEIRKDLLESWWNQPGVTQASALIVWIGFKEDYFKNEIMPNQFKRNVPDGFENIREQMTSGWNGIIAGHNLSVSEWVSRQTYISIGTALNTVQELGLDICASEGFVPSAVGEVLEKHGLIDTSKETVLVGAFVGKVDTNQEFHFAFEKTRKPSAEVYKIIK